MKHYVLAAAGAVAAALVSTPASAAVCIGIAVNGGSISNVACDGGSGSATYNASAGGYFYSVSGTAYPLLTMPSLLTQSVNIQNAGGANAVIDVYLTQTGLVSLNSSLLSTFTSNTISGLSAQITSYYDTANGLFTGTQLQNTLFNAVGTFSGANAVNLTGPWSETVRYRLTFTGGNGSNFNGTANIAAVPEPAAWALMLLGFGGIGFAMRRRRQPALAQLA